MIIKINGRYVNTCKLRVTDYMSEGVLSISLYEDDEEIVTYRGSDWDTVRKQIEQAVSTINNLENTKESGIREIILKQ